MTFEHTKSSSIMNSLMILINATKTENYSVKDNSCLLISRPVEIMQWSFSCCVFKVVVFNPELLAYCQSFSKVGQITGFIDDNLL